MRVCWCILFVLPVLVGTCEASEQSYICTQHIKMFDIIRGSSLEKPTVDGVSKEFIKCLKLPKTAVYVDFDFRVLKLGDGNGITSIKDCRNRAEDSNLGHIQITNGQNDKNPFTCSDMKINTGESKPITWDERKPIVSPDNTLIFNLTKGGTSPFGEVEYVIFANVTSCPDIEGGNITRISQFNFRITCFGGQKATDSSDNYTCVDGYWTQGGLLNSPSCYERELKRLSEEHEEFKDRLAVVEGKLEESSDVASEVVKDVDDLKVEVDVLESKLGDFETKQTYHNNGSYFGFTLLAIVILDRVLSWIWKCKEKIIGSWKKEKSNSYGTARYIRGGRIHQPVDDDDDDKYSDTVTIDL